MARFPDIYGDLDQWGNLLNEALLVSHNTDGTLKTNGEATTLTSGSSIGATTVLVATIPPSLQIGCFIAIGAGTINCEVRRVTNISSLTITFANSSKIAHSSAENVWVVPAVIPLTWYGARGGAGASYDNEPSLQAACDDWTYHQQLLEGFQQIYYISKPLIQSGEMRLRNALIYAKSDFAPLDNNGAMLMMADAVDPVLGSSYLTATVTAADDTFTTVSNHLMQVDAAVVFKGTMPGGVTAGRRYYVIATGLTATAFKVSTTKGGAALNVTSDGSCRVYRNLQALLRWYLDNVRINAGNIVPVCIRAKVQQPGECRKVRVENATYKNAVIGGQDGSWWNFMSISAPTLLEINDGEEGDDPVNTSAYQRFYQLNLEGSFDIGLRAYGHNNVIHDLHFEGGNAGNVGVECHAETLIFTGNTYMNPTPYNPATTLFKLVAGDITIENLDAVSISDVGGGPPTLLDDQLHGETVLLSDMTGSDPTAAIRLFDTSFNPSIGSGQNYQYMIRRPVGGYMKYGGNNVASHSMEKRAATGQTGKLDRWLNSSGTEILSVAPAGFIELGEQSDPVAGATNYARFYARDNGSGKTQLVVRFPTGAIQVIATEP